MLPVPAGPGRLPGRVVVFLAAPVIALLGGCELPQWPEWEVDLKVSLPVDSLHVSEALPKGVATKLADGEEVFVVDPVRAAASYRVGELCGVSCQNLDGKAMEVPGFVGVDTLALLFDQRIASAELRAARLRFSLENGLDFDPLRPHPDPGLAGSLTLVTRSRVTGVLVDSTVISGAKERLAPGSTLTIEKRLSSVTITEGTMTIATLWSPPDGQQSVLALDQRFGFEVVLDEIEVRSVVAVVDSESFQTQLLVDHEGEIREQLLGELANGSTRIESGTIELTVTHELSLDGTLDVSIAGSADNLFSGGKRVVRVHDIDFSFAPEGRSETRDLSAEQVRLLGELDELYVGYRGIARPRVLDSGGRPLLQLTPDQAAAIQLTVGIRLRIGG